MSSFYSGNQTDQQEDAATGVSDQEFVIDGKRPLNRNLVVLVLIAALGGSLIFLMYRSGGFSKEIKPEQGAKAVEDFLAGGGRSMTDMERLIRETEAAFAGFRDNPTDGQIPVEELKLNPFEFEAQSTSTVTGPRVRPPDPEQVARDAFAKLRLGMIIVGSNSSVAINSRMYRIGERLEVDGVSFTVKSIEQGRVVLESATGEYVLERSGGL
jgi:hypothetical protein